MRTILSVLVLFAASVWPLAAQSAENNTTPQAKAGTAETHRWVNEGGPHGGSVEAVAISASDPQVLYAVGSGVVCKSADGGATWHVTALLVPGARAWGFEDVAVDPKTSNTVYVLQRELLFKSTDGGETWRKTQPRTGQFLYRIFVDSRHPDTLYAVTSGYGVLKSTDGGETWQFQNKGLFGRHLTFFAMDEHNPNLLCAYVHNSSAVHVSEDGGATWRNMGGTLEGVSLGPLKRFADDPDRLQIPLRCNDNKEEIICESHNGGARFFSISRGGRYRMSSLLVDDQDPQRIEICVRSQDAGDVYLTTDGAETWRLTTLPFSAWGLSGIRASRTSAGLLFAASVEDEYYFSDDDGRTWEFLYSVADDPGGQDTATIAELRRCRLYGFRSDEGNLWRLVYHPSDLDVAYATRRGRGVVKTEDGGQTWSPVNKGLIVFRGWDIACDAATPGLVYTCGSCGLYKSTDGARSWHSLTMPEVLTPPLGVHPLDPNVLLAGSEWRTTAISTDGGAMWRRIEELPERAMPAAFLFDPEKADHFCVMTKDGVFATTDRGRTWQRRPGTFKFDVRAVADPGWPFVRQTNAAIIYEVESPQAMRRSRDLGQTWEETKPLDTSYDFVRVHPRDPKIVFVGSPRGLYRSTDAGDTWEKIEPPQRAAGFNCIGLDPKDPDTFYLGGCGQQEPVLRTRDGGKTFEKLSNGLPGQGIMRIVVSPTDGAVYAGTEGAGIYRLELEEPASDEGGDE